MTSKEALKEIINFYSMFANSYEQFKENFNIIKQALERLETLEKENEDLTYELSEKHYKMVIYKKAIEKILNQLTELKKVFWITDSYQDYEIILTITELLKEVLNNDK